MSLKKLKRDADETEDIEEDEDDEPALPRERFLGKNLGGRPPKYSTKAELLKKANEYFDHCNSFFQLPEKAGLCLYLNITRETYSQYRKDKRFSDAIKAMDSYIESNWVRRLSGNSATGAIFYLKNAFHQDYRDRVENDITSKGESIQIYIPSRK